MLFTSDNWAGVHPKIMDALVAANGAPAPAYGGDDWTASVRAQFCELFETDCEVFFASTGGAANGLALAQIVPPFGATFCHEASHIQMDECGLPEFYTGGAKLLTLAGEAAKINPAALDEAMRGYAPAQPHHVKPWALSLTQATESGCVYTVAQVEALGMAAKKHHLKVHMDGARFANAVAALGCTPAEITWRAGVDVLCFGATKNGALAAEAVVFFNPADTENFAWRHKRSGHVWSKARFIAAQWSAFLADGLWLDLAGHANAMAARLSKGLRQAGCDVVYEAEINEVFVVFPEGVAEKLQAAGAQFYDWVYPGDQWDGRLKRLVTSYATSEEDVDAFLALL